jgi:hypothetical protein
MLLQFVRPPAHVATAIVWPNRHQMAFNWVSAFALHLFIFSLHPFQLEMSPLERFSMFEGIFVMLAIHWPFCDRERTLQNHG